MLFSTCFSRMFYFQTVNHTVDYIILSERLGFGRWKMDDIKFAMELWGDAEVTKYIGGPFSKKDIKERITKEIEAQQRFNVQYWPVFLITTHEFVGYCGLRIHDINHAIFELGFHLKKAFWGQGYAFEAARAVIDHAFRIVGVTGLFAGHHPDNISSARLLERLGFEYSHDVYYSPTKRNHPSYYLFRYHSLSIQN